MANIEFRGITVSGDCLTLAIVEYPGDMMGKQYLYFTCLEIHESAMQCLSFPGDRDYYPTVDDAVQAAQAHYTSNPELAGRQADAVIDATDDYCALAEYATEGSKRTYNASFTGEDDYIALEVLDTYSQGVTIQLASNGTWSQYPTGG